MSDTAPATDAPTDRGRRRREAVLDAAADRFLDRGFHATSMDEVGAAAGISGPGLYRHFPSKDALLMAVLDRIWLQLRPALEDAAGHEPEGALGVLLAAQLDLAFEQPAALVLLVRELRHLPDDYRRRAVHNHRRYLDAWADAIRAVAEAAGTRLDRDTARGVALAVHGLIDSAALHNQVAPRGLARHRQRALLDELARTVLAAAIGRPVAEG